MAMEPKVEPKVEPKLEPRVEPKVEDLLASIRKAIDDDDTSLPVTMTVEEQGKITRGPIREMRIAYEKPPTPVRTIPPDIETLRARVARTNAEQGFSAPPTPRFRVKAPQDEEPRTSGFTEILAGRNEPQPKEQAPVEPTYIRRSPIELAYDDEFAIPPTASIHELPAPEDLAETEQEFYEQPEPPPLPQHNPYAPPLQHFATSPPPQHQHQQQTALVSHASTQNTRRAFDDLSSAIMSRATNERDFEDMTRDMLRNYLGRWLDENLPSLVEKLVREEIERVARHGN